MTEISLQEDLARLGLSNRRTEAMTDNELGQQDFMTLMIAQFRNQDPFEPMDNGEFLGQLAQFGAVDGIDRLNTSFAGLRESIYSDQALQASNLVGHDVLALSDTAYLPDNGSLRGAVELSASAQNVEVDILGPGGQLVQRIELGERAAGVVDFEWNGLSDELEAAPPGGYRIRARVVRGSSIEEVDTLVNARVDSVSLGGPNGLTLNVAGGQTLTMNQIRRIL